MTRRVTPKQFRILQLLKKNAAAKIPNVTHVKTVHVRDTSDGDNMYALLQVQGRTVRSMLDSDLLIVESSQWIVLNPLVTNLDVSRHWVTVSPKPLPLVK